MPTTPNSPDTSERPGSTAFSRGGSFVRDEHPPPPPPSALLTRADFSNESPALPVNRKLVVGGNSPPHDANSVQSGA